MNAAYSLYCKIHVSVQQQQIDFQMFVTHLSRQSLKSLFSLQILVTKMMFFLMKLGCIHFFSSTCGLIMKLYGQSLLPNQSQEGDTNQGVKNQEGDKNQEEHKNQE